jgi:hypothetical protein
MTEYYNKRVIDESLSGLVGADTAVEKLLTVAAGETKTSLEVKAASSVDSTKSGTKTVTVIPPRPKPPHGTKPCRIYRRQ